MSRRILVSIAQLATLALLIWAWQNCSAKQATYLSRPSDILDAMIVWLTSPTYHYYILITLAEAALGLVMACTLAVAVAGTMAFVPIFGVVISPFVTLANAVPRVALAPLFLLVFGIGLWSKVLFVATAVVFFPLFSIYRALTTIEPETVQNAQMLGASRSWLVRDVYIPAATSAALTSLRIAVTFALLTAVLAEFMSSQAGIGFAIMDAQNALQPDFAIAGIVVLGVLAMVLDVVVLATQRRVLSWR